MKRGLPPTTEPNEGIELLYTRDCRIWPEALRNLQTALATLNIREEPRLVPVDTLDQAEAYGFFASPTIHLSGIDVDPHARRISKRGLGSGRPYFYHGLAYPAPPVDLIAQSLRELYLGQTA